MWKNTPKNVIIDPPPELDPHQNIKHSIPYQISCKSVWCFLRNPANLQTKLKHNLHGDNNKVILFGHIAPIMVKI